MNTRVHTLPDLQRELARIHRARLTRRRAIATGVVALPAIALFFALVPSGGRTGFQPVSPTVAASESFVPTPLPLPLGEGMSASSPTGEGSSHIIIQSMTDDELLAALAEAGQPSGIVRIDGKATVVANTFPDATSPLAPFGASISADRQ